jgi:hypothetical protein
MVTTNNTYIKIKKKNKKNTVRSTLALPVHRQGGALNNMEGAPGSRSLAKEKPTETPSSKTEAGQQHLAQFNNKKKQLKSHNLNTKKNTPYFCTTLQSSTKCLQKKKHGRSSPVDFHPRS